jgi:steroid delta-isomerase-like uncharacterized protein
VEEHIQQENQHDLDGIMATFGENAWYDNEPVGEHHDGRDSVRAYYEDLLQALPDFHIDIHQRHVTDEHVILEVTISGTHKGNWRGLPGTGRDDLRPGTGAEHPYRVNNPHLGVPFRRVAQRMRRHHSGKTTLSPCEWYRRTVYLPLE